MTIEEYYTTRYALQGRFWGSDGFSTLAASNNLKALKDMGRTASACEYVWIIDHDEFDRVIWRWK